VVVRARRSANAYPTRSGHISERILKVPKTLCLEESPVATSESWTHHCVARVRGDSPQDMKAAAWEKMPWTCGERASVNHDMPEKF
jgi:hypothetical protein